MDTAIEVTNGDENVVCPSDFHHGLILLLHTSHHMFGEGIGLWHFNCILTRMSITYLDCPDPGWTETIDDMLINSIILDIFTGGNFGRKQEG